jgi:hypothetical protein
MPTLSRRSYRLSALILSLATWTLPACSDSPLEPVPQTVHIAVAGPNFNKNASAGSTILSPASAGVQVGQTVQLVALDGAGATLRGKWSSHATAVATVSGDGLVTGHAAGSASITFTANGNKGSATAQVSVTAVAQPLLTPATACAALPRLRTVPVSSAKGLEEALAGAQPGDVIELAAGMYTGFFKASRSGTAEHRIALCGPRDALLQTGLIDRGHALWLDGASYWTLQGFTAGTALGGISITSGNHNHIVGVRVQNTGMHGIRIGIFSSHTVVRDSEVLRTGRTDPEFGEGIYVGSWSGSWCSRTNCQPDRSDNTQIVNNRFGPDITAEHVQVMEGTTGGVIRGNEFDGRGMGAPGAPHVDSWVAVMGNGYLVEDNRGKTSLRNGFEVWVELSGWGRNNTLRRNTADVGASGYGFHVGAGADGSVIACDNTALNAGSGLSNVACK